MAFPLLARIIKQASSFLAVYSLFHSLPPIKVLKNRFSGDTIFEFLFFYYLCLCLCLWVFFCFLCI